MTEHAIAGSPYAFYAFYCLYRHFFQGPGHGVTLSAICEKLYPNNHINVNEKTSLFITWKKKSHSKHDYLLRGCIGTFSKLPLEVGIGRFALVAALEDTRFSPISENELPNLKCYCNILQNCETIFSSLKKTDTQHDIFNWTIGKHGIELKFRDPSNNKLRSATFLPDVMVEQGWDKEDTFRNLLEKAGCVSNIDDIMNNYEQYFIEVIRYEGNKSSINYKDFKNGLDRISRKH